MLTRGRSRDPDVLVARTADLLLKAKAVQPVAVFEILADSTASTDLRVKPLEYAGVPSIVAYVILSHDCPEGATVLRRSADWNPKTSRASLELPEIRVSLSSAELYQGWSMVEGVGFEPT